MTFFYLTGLKKRLINVLYQIDIGNDNLKKCFKYFPKKAILTKIDLLLALKLKAKCFYRNFDLKKKN